MSCLREQPYKYWTVTLSDLEDSEAALSLMVHCIASAKEDQSDDLLAGQHYLEFANGEESLDYDWLLWLQ